MRINMTSILNLTAWQLRRAAEVKEKIDGLQKELNKLLGGVRAAPDGAPRKRRMSAAGIARIRAAAKAAAKPKRGMSAAAKAKLAAIARARWKAAKAKGKTTL
jgi:hypothetical protein